MRIAMTRTNCRVALLASLALVALPACTALEQLAALRTVTFAFAGISDVRAAGIRVGPGASYGSLSSTDITRLGAAIVARNIPLDMIAHVSATNPPDNTVTARVPGNPNLLPRGYYMLFALNRAGVPAIAPWVRIV